MCGWWMGGRRWDGWVVDMLKEGGRLANRWIDE